MDVRVYSVCLHVFLKPFLDSLPERGSMGLRLFSSNHNQSLRREMKESLSKIVKNLQEEMDNLSKSRSEDQEMSKDEIKLIEFLPVCLRLDMCYS